MIALNKRITFSPNDKEKYSELSSNLEHFRIF